MIGSDSQFTRCLQMQHDLDNRRVQSLEGEAGHLQAISLQNFMCHEHFTLEFGPRINFVIGPNGSMFVCLYVCLFHMFFYFKVENLQFCVVLFSVLVVVLRTTIVALG